MTLTASVSALLLCVFILVAVLVRRDTLDRRFRELSTKIDHAAYSLATGDSMLEMTEDFPGMQITVYGASGEIQLNNGSVPAPKIVGQRKIGKSLCVGVLRSNRTFVGSESWEESEHGIHLLELALALLWAPIVAIIGMVSWLAGGMMMKPVRELLSSAKHLTASPSDELLATPDDAEFGELAEQLNHLIESVRHSGQLQEQFASDAAHELRTPLSILRTRLELNLQQPRSAEVHVTAQRAMLKQVERLTNVVEALLLSAASQVKEPERIDLAAEVGVTVMNWAEASDLGSEDITLDLGPSTAQVGKTELEIVLRNVMDNALRHRSPGTPIVVRTTMADGTATVEVENQGESIAEADLRRVFDRFYRSDSSRERSSGGAGIGLSVVKRIVESLDGTVEFLPVTRGACLRVSLPAQRP